MRAIMSFPVPLSPWIRTGTFAPANLVNRSRTACIVSVRPKTIASGGISPNGWTSVFTVVLVMGWLLPAYRGDTATLHPASQTCWLRKKPMNSDYLLEDYQLTDTR